MNQRNWEELVDLIDQRYKISRHKNIAEKLEDAPELERTIERIEFTKDGTDFRVDRIDAPAIIDKKTFYNKVGSSQHSQNVYDPEERAARLAFYQQQNSGEWLEIKPEQLLS